MPDAILLAAAVLCSTAGMAWLALAMKVHWQQVRSDAAISEARTRMLRVLGILALAASLWLCLAADHGSIAALVWVMALAASALSVAFTLTWRPRALGLLVFWVPRG